MSCKHKPRVVPSTGPVAVEDLQAQSCPDCGHSEPSELRPSCHRQAPVRAVFMSNGTVRLFCSVCLSHVITILLHRRTGGSAFFLFAFDELCECGAEATRAAVVVDSVGDAKMHAVCPACAGVMQARAEDLSRLSSGGKVKN